MRWNDEMPSIIVVDYDPAWPVAFERLRATIWPVVSDVALTIEHVGSTSVPGLAAKPIIDMSVVVPTASNIPIAIERLATLGYTHIGNLGVDGREAFSNPDGTRSHHLYLCPRDGLGLANHLAVRHYLRGHPEVAKEYGELKKQLAKGFPEDIDSYIDGKTDLIMRILRAVGVSSDRLDAIERANRKGG
jgi:GrpB-like predicted nucleotidyltransferase (UPF0157 family)